MHSKNDLASPILLQPPKLSLLETGWPCRIAMCHNGKEQLPKLVFPIAFLKANATCTALLKRHIIIRPFSQYYCEFADCQSHSSDGNRGWKKLFSEPVLKFIWEPRSPGLKLYFLGNFDNIFGVDLVSVPYTVDGIYWPWIEGAEVPHRTH